MKIAIDASSSAVPQKTGVAKYIQRLLENLERIDNNNEYLICYRLSRWKRREHFYKPQNRNVKVKLFQEPFFFGRGIDVFHGPDVRLPHVRGPRLIATVHDVFSLIFDEYADEEFRKKKIAAYKDVADRVDRILFDSEATRDDFIRFYPQSESKARVINLAVDDTFLPQPAEEVERVKKKYGIRSEYILYVGTISLRKNFPRMFEAFMLAQPQIPSGIQFVAAGKLTYGKDEILRYIEDNRCGSSIHLPGYIDQDDLPALYTGARMLLFTTLYEGFGMPILEALSCGIPVVTSNSSSMDEIAAQATTRVDCTDVDAIATAIVEGLNKSPQTLIPKADLDKLLSHYRWTRTAQQTLKAYVE